MTFSLDLGDSCAGAVSALLANPGLLLGWILWLRSLWAGTMSPRLCGHLGKEGTQESMESVLWSRLGARTQGAPGPLPVLTCKMTFRAMVEPSLLCSLYPQSICGMGEVGGWGHMVAYPPLGEQGKMALLPFAPSLNSKGGPSSPLLEDGVKSQSGMGSFWASLSS